MEQQMKTNCSIVVRIAFLVIGKGKRLMSKANKRMHTIFIDSFTTTSFNRDSRLHSSFGSSSLVEYEFSCNNSPDILFYHRPNKLKMKMKMKMKMKKPSFRGFFFVFFFPCLSDAPEALEEALSRHENRRRVVFPDKTPDFERDNYSEFSENDKGSRVDDAAEEFIKRFYEQLKGERDQSFHAASDSDP